MNRDGCLRIVRRLRRDALQPQSRKSQRRHERALAARGRDLYGMDVNFRGETAPEFELNETDASHLYRIFPKLGIGSRTQLIALSLDLPTADD